MTRLPADMPRPVLTALAALAYSGYRFDRLVWHPASREPLARVYLTGPRWFLLYAGLAWLVAYGLYRFPLTRSVGAALIRYRAVPQPIMYVDAAGVAH